MLKEYLCTFRFLNYLKIEMNTLQSYSLLALVSMKTGDWINVLKVLYKKAQHSFNTFASHIEHKIEILFEKKKNKIKAYLLRFQTQDEKVGKT